MANSVQYIRGIKGGRPELFKTIVRIDNGTTSDAFTIPGILTDVKVGVSSAAETLTLQDSNGFDPVTIAADDVDADNDTITISSHPFHTGQEVVPATTAGGLTGGTTYFVIDVDVDTISIASSAANAIAGTEVDISAAAITLNPLFADTSVTITASTSTLARASASTMADFAGTNNRPGVYRFSSSGAITSVITIYSTNPW